MRTLRDSLQIEFRDGSKTDKIDVEYPIGHRRRREEGIPVLWKKFAENLRTRFDEKRSSQIESSCKSDQLGKMGVDEFMKMLVK